MKEERHCWEISNVNSLWRKKGRWNTGKEGSGKAKTKGNVEHGHFFVRRRMFRKAGEVNARVGLFAAGATTWCHSQFTPGYPTNNTVGVFFKYLRLRIKFFCDSLSTAYTRLWAMAGFILQEKLFALLCNDRCIGVIMEDLDACFKVKARNMEECLSRSVLCCPWDKIKWFDRSPFNCGEEFHSCLLLYLETALKAKNIFLTTLI